MTIERESSFDVSLHREGPDSDATVKMPRPSVPASPDAPDVDGDGESFDPESTLVREDWESTVIRRVAPHVVAVQSQVAGDANGENRFGWEAECLRRLAHEVRKVGI
ncbi:hypothetical protein [Povalibacter sp.]|uniref:hypothetical protein n=1 Tax=Povalibacter sp. TaxID=1962978 RepID=UPI002F401E93